MERFWETSARVALIGAKIAGGAGVDRSEAHTFGLFRDCGMPVMLRKYPVYEDLLDGSALSVDVPITDIEAERYAFDHTMVGLHLAERWGLPESMQFAIRHHHDYAAWPALPRAAQGLAAVALVAEEVAARLSRRRSCADWALGGAAALACLDVDEDRVGEWAAATKAGLAGG
jgi:HD-like signal output (HDOD) protein